MKTAIIIVDKVKQIVFTPETESDKDVLKMFTPDDNIELAIKSGNVYGSACRSTYETYGYEINMCKGDYFRAYEGKESIMLILSPKNGVL